MTNDEIITMIKEDEGYLIYHNIRMKDAIPIIIQSLEAQQWIPVGERLPEKYKYTLWCASSGHIQSDYFNGKFWEEAKKYGYEVVAWMPLPQPYNEDEADGE